MFRFIHAADIHLDSSRSGLSRDNSSLDAEVRNAPRQAMLNLVNLALQQQIDFLLIAGDLYDQDWKDFRTGLFFVEQMHRLQEAGIPVLLIAGNHDAANKMTKSLRWPDNVRLFSAKRAETVRLDDLDVAVHGQSFLRAAVTENLAIGFPGAIHGLYNIGLLHTCANHSGEHDRYAPCSIRDLQNKEYDYWALGHVHTREILCEEPYIVFPGNLQGRHVRETGPRGCMLVTVDDSGATSLEFKATDVLRWERCRVDGAQADTADEIVQIVARQFRELIQHSDGLPLAVRVEIHGRSLAHGQLAAEPQRWEAEIHSAAVQHGEGRIWIEKVTRATRQPTASGTLDGPLGELVEFIGQLRNDAGALQDLTRSLSDLQKKLPPELSEGKDALQFDQVERIRDLLDDVEPMLMHRLLAQEDAS